MKRFWPFLPALLVFSGLSCDHNEYRIEMTPAGDALERTLTVDRFQIGNIQPVPERPGPGMQTRPAVEANAPAYIDVPPEELEALTKIYKTSTPGANPKVHRFVGRFKDKTPNDVGGAGRYACYETGMGTAFAYVERFRGNDSPADEFQAMYKSADKTMDLIVGWAKSRWGDRKDFPALRRFLDEDVRKDIKNIATYAWMVGFATRSTPGEHGAAASVELKKEIAARASQYLLERGYVGSEDVPKLFRIFMDGDNKTKLAAAGELLRKMLTTKAQITDKGLVDDLLGLIDKPDESFQKYVRGTEEFKKLQADWEQKKKTDPNAPEPTVSDLGGSLEDVFHLDLDWTDSDDSLGITLASGTSPLATNGLWDANTGRIVWELRVKTRRDAAHGPPTICYAVWVKPDEKFQKEHLGKVALTGADLLDYCLWFSSLNLDEADSWNTVLRNLRPGPEAIEKLKLFNTPKDTTPYAQHGAETLLKALERKEK
jgi:hypothetical protein